jgi:hypothetical protein
MPVKAAERLADDAVGEGRVAVALHLGEIPIESARQELTPVAEPTGALRLTRRAVASV